MTSLIGPGGGVLPLDAPDGSFWELSVPAGAISAHVEITMTLLEAVDGSPLGDELVSGVRLEPAGLEFSEPATLTLHPSSPLEPGTEGPFSAASDGSDFVLHPIDPASNALRLPIRHFSIFGFFQTDRERRSAMIRRTARNLEAQLGQEIADLVIEGRADETAARQFGDRLTEQFEVYRDRVVRPMMTLAETDHLLFREAARRLFGWARGLLLTLGDDAFDRPPFAADYGPLMESYSRAFSHFIEATYERCAEEHQLGAFIDLLRLEREAQLLGFSTEEADGQAWQRMHDCLTFEVRFDSAFTLGGELPAIAADMSGTMVHHAAATIQVPSSALGGFIAPPEPVEASLEWVEVQYDVTAVSRLGPGGCAFSGEPGAPGTFRIENLSLVPEFSEAVRPDGEVETTLRLRDVQLMLDPGSPLDILTTRCTHGSDTSESEAWRRSWDSARADERTPGTDAPWLLTGWHVGSPGDELLATLTFESNEVLGGVTTMTESTRLELRHAPGEAPSDSRRPQASDPPASSRPPAAEGSLEEALPAEIAGTEMERTFGSLAEFPDGADEALVAELESRGLAVDEAEIGVLNDPSGRIEAFAVALLVPGAGPDALTDAVLAAGDAEYEERRVGGRSVLVADNGVFPAYVYASGDILFTVLAPNNQAAAIVLSALP